MSRVTESASGPGGSPTLDEVARLAGVSRATASRAINGRTRVSQKARDAVDAAVRTLGYAPNPAARSLVTRRTDSVALVVPEPDDRLFTDPFFAHTLRGVSRVLAERDLQLVLLLARPGEQEQRMLRYLRNRHIDGALVVSHHRSDNLADHLAALDLPCAFVGRPWTSADKVAYVDTDNVAGEREATRVLMNRGCKRIGTIAGPTDMTAGVDRLDGWRAAMRDAGIAPDAVAYGDFTESGRRGRRGRAARAAPRHRRARGRLGPDGGGRAARPARRRAPGARRRRRRGVRRPRRRRADHPAAHHGAQPDRRDGGTGHQTAP